MTNNKKSMTVSVAIATYNGAAYLSEQLDSVIAQSVSPFEICVCDDCSTDGTYELLLEYERRYDFIHITKNTENLGFKKNFEKVMGMCKGDFIALCDQDDIWTPNHIEVLLGIIADKMMAVGNSLLIDSTGKSLGITLKEQEALCHVYPNPLDLVYTIIFYRNPFQGASMLIRKDMLKYVLPIPDDVNYHDTWISSLSCFLGGFSYTSEIVNKYRRHGNNATGANLYVKKNWKKYFWRHLRYNYQMDRKAILDAITQRCIDISSEEQINTIKTLQKIVNRRTNIIGRFVNVWFTLLNYKRIYSLG